MPNISKILAEENASPYLKIQIRKDSGRTFELTNLSGEFAALSIKEQEYKFPQAQLSLYDPTGVHAKLCTWGTRIVIEWGFEVKFQFPWQLLQIDEVRPQNLTAFVRGPIIFTVIGISQTLGAPSLLNLELLCYGSKKSKQKKTKLYESGTLEDIIKETAGEMGATAVTQIDPEGPHWGLYVIPEDPLRRENETPAAFLKKIAARARAKLVYAHNPYSGESPKVLVVSNIYEKTFQWSEQRGLPGKYHYVDYNVSGANLKDDFSFRTNFNAPGGSTIIPFMQANGKWSIQVVASKQERVEVYKLDNAQVEKDAKSKEGSQGAILIQKALAGNVAGFNYRAPEIFRYFDLSTETTAPEGFGHTGSGSVLLNPLYGIGDLIWAGYGQTSGISPIFRTHPGREYETSYRIIEMQTKVDSRNWGQSITIGR